MGHENEKERDKKVQQFLSSILIKKSNKSNLVKSTTVECNLSKILLKTPHKSFENLINSKNKNKENSIFKFSYNDARKNSISSKQNNLNLFETPIKNEREKEREGSDKVRSYFKFLTANKKKVNFYITEKESINSNLEEFVRKNNSIMKTVVHNRSQNKINSVKIQTRIFSSFGKRKATINNEEKVYGNLSNNNNNNTNSAVQIQEQETSGNIPPLFFKPIQSKMSLFNKKDLINKTVFYFDSGNFDLPMVSL
jgi:hypothetical protein